MRIGIIDIFFVYHCCDIIPMLFVRLRKTATWKEIAYGELASSVPGQARNDGMEKQSVARRLRTAHILGLLFFHLGCTHYLI